MKINKLNRLGAECKLVRYLARSLPRLREICAVDIDRELLESPIVTKNTEPLFFDYMEPREETKLTVTVMEGSVTDFEARLKGVDAVVAIEL